MGESTLLDGIRDKIAEMRAFATEENVARVEQVLASGDNDLNALNQVIPWSLTEFIVLLNSKIMFHSVVTALPASSRNELEEARHIAATHFGELANSPAVLDAIERERAKSEQTERPNINETFAFNRIQGLSTFPNWVESSSKFSPLVRIGFHSADRQLLLDSTMTWADLANLTAALTEVLASECTRAERMARIELLEVPKSDSVSNGISRIEAALERVKTLASVVGLSLSTAQFPATEPPA